jgi:hypothetical protein
MNALAIASPRRLAVRPLGMVLLETGAVVGFALAGVWAWAPELVLCAGLGLGILAIHPRKAWAAPVAGAAATLAGYATGVVHLSPILGAAAVVGAAASWLWPRPTTRLDTFNAALAGAAGAGIALYASTSLIPWDSLAGAAGVAAAVALGASACLVPLVLRYEPIIPTRREINAALQPAYRAPVFRAVEMYRITVPKTPDLDTRTGLAEIVTWVLRLQVTLQTLDAEIGAIPVERTQKRIEDLGTGSDDPFTRERKEATAVHLRRMLAHREAMTLERGRTAALVDYALSSLEESRAGIALGHQLPGEATPERIPEVLGRLRAHAADGEARRRTDRELRPLS